VALYLAAQILIPLRHWLYPGDVNWTEEGHRFSWRMKLRSKDTRLFVTLRDADTGREWSVAPGDGVQPWQLDEMATRPDMILQYAHYVAAQSRSAVGVAHPRVFVEALCSLNGAPEQPLIDPHVDLAAEPRSLRHARWILPRSSQPRVVKRGMGR
jgi:hypothetical protein